MFNADAKHTFKIIDSTSSISTPATVQMNIRNNSGAVEFYKTNETGNALAGAVFSLYLNGNQTAVATAISDATGRVYFPNLVPGNYVIRETQAASGYVRNTAEISFVIDEKITQADLDAQTYKLVNNYYQKTLPAFKNYQGSVELTKYARIKVDEISDIFENKPLPGAIYKVFKVDGTPVQSNQEFVTDTAGKITVDKLAPGNYYFQEVSSSDVLLTNTVKINFTIVNEALNEPTVVVKEAVNKRAKIQFMKKFEGNDPDQWFAAFILSYPNDPTRWVSHAIIDKEQGLVSFDDIAPGTYWIFEEFTDENYIRVNTPIEVIVPSSFEGTTADDQYVVTTQEITNYQGSVKLTKQTFAGTPIAGVEFELYEKDTDDPVQADKVFKTGADGTITVNGLPHNAYYFKEKSSATGFINKTDNTYDFVINPETDSFEKPLVVMSPITNYQGAIKFLKTDEIGTPLNGAEFSIYEAGKSTPLKTVTAGSSVYGPGYVYIDGLAPGTYDIKETKATNDYIRNTKVIENVVIDAEITDTDLSGAQPKYTFAHNHYEKTLNETFKNYQGKAELTKYLRIQLGFDEYTNILSDKEEVAYKIFRADGTQVQADKEFKTDINGKITIDKLAPGDYYFQEVAAPTGFVTNTVKINFTIVNEALNEPTVVAKEAINKKAKIQFSKNVEGKSKDWAEMNGIEFEIFMLDEDGEEMGVEYGVTPNAEGMVIFDHISPGTYWIREIATHADYINVNALVEVVIPDTFEGTTADEQYVMTTQEITNYQGSVKLTKHSINGTPIEGATFDLWRVKQPKDERVTIDGTNQFLTNANGIIEVSGLPPGDYYFNEMEANPDYVLYVENRYDFTIEPDTDTFEKPIVQLPVTNYQGAVEFTKTSEDGITPLAGAEFAIYKKGNTTALATTTSTAAGYVYFDKLAPGDYEIKETKAAPNHILNTNVIDVTILDRVLEEDLNDPQLSIRFDEQKGHYITTLPNFTNYQGIVVLAKTASVKQADNSIAYKELQGVVYEIRTETGTLVATDLVTDADGLIIYDKLAPGKYYFKELSSQEGYLANQAPLHFEIIRSENGEPNIVEVSAVNHKAKVEFQKNYAGTIPTEQATFELWKKAATIGQADTLITTQKPEANGKLTVDNLEHGTYYFKEIAPGTGYIQNTTLHEFVVPATYEGLTPETQYVHNAGVFTNYQGSVELTKLGAVNPLGVNGAQFQVYKADGTLAKSETYTTTNNGKLRVDGLEPGAYYFKETSTTTDYIFNPDQTYPFVINDSITSAGQPIEQVTVTNYQGAVKFTKTDAHGNLLAGAEFTLYQADGVTVAKPTIQTDATGIVYFAGLKPGSYVVKETSAALGFVRNIKPILVTIAPTITNEILADSTKNIAFEAGHYVYKLNNFVNYKASIRLIKQDEAGAGLAGVTYNLYKDNVNGVPIQTNLTTIGGILEVNELAPGTYYLVEQTTVNGNIVNTTPLEFVVAAAVEDQPITVERTAVNKKARVEFNKVAMIDGALVPQAGAEFTLFQSNTEVQKTTAGTNGAVVFEGITPGSYSIKETTPVAGFIKNTRELLVEIPATTTEDKVVVDFTDFVNYQGTLQLTKTDETGATLEGVEYQVFVQGTNERVQADKVFKTNASGILTVDKLAPGQYYVKEVATVNGNIINETPITFEVAAETLEAPTVIERTATNKKARVEFNKVAMVDGALVPPAGAEFTLFQGNTEVQKTTSAQNGAVVFEGITPGNYSIKETTPVAGFIKNTRELFVEIPTTTAEDKIIRRFTDFINYQGTLQLTKTDETGAVLEGVEYQVFVQGTNERVQADKVFKTNTSGILTVDKLAPGNYYVKEVATVGGNIINETPITFEVSAETLEAPTVIERTATNKKARVEFNKVAMVDGAFVPQAGAEFTLFQGSTEVQKATSAQNGAVVFEGITPGNYIIKETTPVTGFIKNTRELIVEIPTTTTADKVVLNFTDFVNYQGSIRLYKQDKDDAPLNGVTYDLYKGTPTGTPIETGIQTTNGMIERTGLTPDTYYLVETATVGNNIINTTPIEFVIHPEAFGQPPVVEQTVKNYAGAVKFVKTDANNTPLAGAEFTLYHANGMTEAKPAITTDATGLVYFNELAPGSYVLVETKAAPGFIRNMKPIPFDIAPTITNAIITDITSNIAIENGYYVHRLNNFANYQGTILLNKQDRTGLPLNGVTYDLYKGAPTGTPIETGIHTVDGKIFYTGLTPDTYYLVETATVGNNLVNATPIEFTIAPDTDGIPPVVEKTTQNYSGAIKFLKTTADGTTPLAGAEFTLSRAGKPDIIKTAIATQDGMVYFEDIAPGTYDIKESVAAPGYIRNTSVMTVTIDNTITDADTAGAAPKYTLANNYYEKLAPNVANYQGAATLVKTIGNTDTPLSGATFAVYLATDDTLIQDGLVSDTNGLVRVTGLAPGTYYFQETIAAPGYTKNTTKKGFVIASSITPEMLTPESGITFDGTYYVTAAGTIPNFKQTIRLTKTDEANQPLHGVTFDLYKDLVGGTPYKTALTTEFGVLEIGDLTPGTYYFVETATVAGNIVNSTPIKVDIEDAIHGEPTVQEITVINKKAQVNFTKVDSKGNSLAGSIFELYQQHTDPAQQDTLITTVTSDTTGLLTYDGLAPGNYYFKESSATPGYITNTVSIPFAVPTTTTDDKVVIVPENFATFTNYKGSVRLTKVDEAGTRLAGVTYNLYNGTPTGTPHATDLTTDAQGQITVDELAPGTYYFAELSSTNGNLVNTTPIEVIIAPTAAGTPERVEVQATNTKAAIHFTKVAEIDGVHIPQAGAEFTIYQGETAVATAIAQTDGLVSFDGLAPGDYIIKETKAASGYILNTREIPVHIPTTSEQTKLVLTLDNVVNYQGSVRLTKTDETGKLLVGVVYDLYDATNTLVQAGLTTQLDGTIEVDKLAPGNYYFKESSSVEGNIVNTTPVEFTIVAEALEAPSVAQVTATNTKAQVNFTKTDSEGNALAGSTFELYQQQTDPEQEDTLITTVTSDTTGLVTYDGLAPGNYYFKESAATPGYILNTVTIPFNVPITAATDKIVLILDNFINYQGGVVIEKVDTHGNLLKEADFALYDTNGGLVTTGTTLEGSLTFTKLAPGTYRLVETKAPTDYLINEIAYEILIPTT